MRQPLYAASENTFADRPVLHIPFAIGIDPMERLLLINFEKDPDAVYLGFEPQVFNDSTNGEGMLVIGWRVDGKVDVYHQPGLRLQPEKYDIAGKGLAHLVERPLADAFFNVDAFGAQAFFAFSDVQGRPIRVKVRERNAKKREPFGLLAPMGDAAENPSALPLVLLHDFYFVRRKHTAIFISIDGRSHTPDPLPFPMDWSAMYFTRYSPDPVIATINPAFDGQLPRLDFQDKTMAILSETSFALVDNGGIPEIKSLSRSYKNHTVRFSFNPAFPNISALADKAMVAGTFTIAGHPATGSIQGEYRVEKNAGEIRIRMVPSRGWIPNETKFSLTLLYSVAKIFRKWPATYRWTAFVQTDASNQMYMKSSWERVRK